MAVIPSKFASCDFATTRPTARAGPNIFSRLLGAMMKSYRRREYTEIARYQHLMGRQLTDSVALDTERRMLPIL